MSELVQVDDSRADFFVTGDEYMRDSLNLQFIPRATLCDNTIGGGVILAQDKQDLRQSLSVAKDFFERTKPGAIKFVLIGLSPAQAVDEKILGDYFKLCLDNGAKPVAVILPVSAAIKKTYNADALKAFRDTINRVVKKYKATFVDLLDVKLSDELFQVEMHLNAEGKAAVTALLGEQLYFKSVLSQQDICAAPGDFFNLLSKHFADYYKTLIHHVFCKMACEDFKRLSETLPHETCMDLMVRVFSEMTYNHLANLSDMLNKDDYNEVAARVFKISAEKISHKDKIKVGFYFAYSSFYFGDDLYNLFANDERFEPTLFVHTRVGNKAIKIERTKDAERFISHGINVFALDDKNLSIPAQDILFCLTPYQGAVPGPFRMLNLRLTTLMVNFPYTFSVCDRGGLLGSPFVRTLWKIFCPSATFLKLCQIKSKVGMPRGIYSGYPKLDVFFKHDAKFHFDWKMTRPDAKKIIWAPHHSITNNGPVLATFHWNYKFMYEFAKAHPETSWVVKTHPHLPIKAVNNKIFPSIAAYEEYMQMWDDLPNAQVYRGAYYQDVFTTSDGMIQDCASFVAEYQYVDKPMIYLTRDTQKFNELGEEILNASYTVDGKDLDGIAAMIQRVFINGDDYKAAERKEVFDKYLNYPKANGMLASEFIFKNICDELKLPPR